MSSPISGNKGYALPQKNRAQQATEATGIYQGRLLKATGVNRR